MGIRKRRDGGPERVERFYAFADTVVDPGFENPRLRLSVQFDAVNADYFDSLEDDIGSVLERPAKPGKGLGVIRVLTTHKRLQSMGTEIPRETDWLEIQIAKERNTPRAWFASAETGLVPGRGINAPQLNSIDREEQARLIEKLDAFCTAPSAKRVTAAAVLERMDLSGKKNLSITALDVGQASCNAFSNGSVDVGYFDVGRPLIFNRHSFPGGFKRRYPSEGFVLLSHWDFDHYALAVNNPSLMSLDWYAPQQKVGPYTAQFQRLLGSRLHFITGNASFAGAHLERGLGKNANDRNSTGYIFRFERRGEAVLLTGDADYVHIGTKLKTGATAVALPHHGGKGSEPPKPAACLHPTAVASYGIPNNYKHPDEDHLAAHTKKGWRIRRTAAHGTRPRIPRAERLLFPLGQIIVRPVVAARKLETV